MKKFALSLMILLILSSSALGEEPRQLIGVALTEPAAAQQLALRGLDIWEVREKEALVYASQEERRWLEEHGFAYFVRADAATLSALIRNVDGYLTFAEYVSAMTTWATTYPGHASLSSLGTSWEGRDIWMLKVSDNVAVDEDEPEVLLIALQHAREWLAGMTLYGIAEHVITRYGHDPGVTDLVDTMELYIVLVANPDGYVYTHTVDRYWRKNRRDNGDGTYGVDLNRNFAWEWESGISPSSIVYPGPAPFSEPETQALHNWILSRGSSLVGCLNYHAYGTRVMHNWAYTFDLPPNVDVMGPLAREVALAIEAVNGQRMRNGSWAITLDYTGGGSTNDHLHASLGIPTLTFELGATGGFAPPGTSIDPTQRENIPGATTFLQWARTLAGDVTPPWINDLHVSGISDTYATLSWTTDEPATRAAQYGLTTIYSSTEEPDRLRGRTHQVTLTGLSPATEYHARARAENLAALVSYSTDVAFTTAATPQDLTPPDYPDLLSLRRVAAGVLEVRWDDSTGTGTGGYRLYESEDGQIWSLVLDESTLTYGLSSATLPAPPVSSLRYYRMTAIDSAPAKNESIPSDTYAFLTSGDPAPVLIVDGYDRWNGKRIAQNRNHAFAADHGRAVAACGAAFETCANQEVGGPVTLSDYSAVLWVLGDESDYDSTFTPTEQALVEAYLEAGGQLFVSGSEIAWDLDRLSGPTAADRAFFHDYLCAQYATDNTSDYDVFGTGGSSIFASSLVRFDEGSRGIYRVETPDRITPTNGAVAALMTLGGEIVAVQREGIFGGGTSSGRLVYLAFPFETIFPVSSQTEVMQAVLGYFRITSTLVDGWRIY